MFKITDEVLGEEILDKCKAIDVKISEEAIEVVSGTVILIEVGVGLEEDTFW